MKKVMEWIISIICSTIIIGCFSWGMRYYYWSNISKTDQTQTEEIQVKYTQSGNTIIPGLQLGEIQLGMSCDDVHQEKIRWHIQSLECDMKGLLVSIESNTGGILVFNKVTVGDSNVAGIVHQLGRKFITIFDLEHPEGGAFYISYPQFGISFRIVSMVDDLVNTDENLPARWPYSRFIQSVKIFVPSETRTKFIPL